MKTEHDEDRFQVTLPEPVALQEESLVTDTRAGLSPAQMVERKLVSLLPGTPLPLSQMQGVNIRRSLS
jgi:hypothetical protein